MNEKPYDCTCEYPKIVLRNGSGHNPNCPYHKRFFGISDPIRATTNPMEKYFSQESNGAIEAFSQ